MSKRNNYQRVKKFYVYGHYTEDDVLFYIGIGTITNNSLKEKSKYNRAYHFSRRTKFWNNVKNKYGIIVKILSEFDNKESCLLEEKRLIERYGKRINGGLLCNLSDGGEIGPIGHKKPMSEAQKKLLSEMKSLTLYIYNSDGSFIREEKTIKRTASYCGVTYNAIHSCMKTKNYSNGFFIFKEYRGLTLGYTAEDLNFQSPLSKCVTSENMQGMKIKHNSIFALAEYLQTDRKNVKRALKTGRLCKKHKVYFEGAISSQDS